MNLTAAGSIDADLSFLDCPGKVHRPAQLLNVRAVSAG